MSSYTLTTGNELKGKSMPWDTMKPAAFYSKMKSAFKPRRAGWDGATTPGSSAPESETSTVFEIELNALQLEDDGESLEPEDYRLPAENRAWTTSDARGVTPVPRSFPRPAKDAECPAGYEHSPKGLFGRTSKKAQNTSGVTAELLDAEDRAWM